MFKENFLMRNFDRYFKILDSYQHFECPVCLMDVPLRDRPSRAPTARCSHEPKTCQRCLGEYLKEKILNGKWKDVQCLEAHCGATFNDEELRTSSTVEVFKKCVLCFNGVDLPNRAKPVDFC
jgi:hypothetical protein